MTANSNNSKRIDVDRLMGLVALHPTSDTVVAEIAGCSRTTVGYYRRKAARDAGIEFKSRRGCGSGFGKPRIRWDAEAVGRLTAILARVPRPENHEIAHEMGLTLSAVTTAMSRFNLTNNTRPKDSGGQYEKPHPHEKRVRACMNCRRPFGSDGFHNRLCNDCKAVELEWL